MWLLAADGGRIHHELTWRGAPLRTTRYASSHRPGVAVLEVVGPTCAEVAEPWPDVWVSERSAGAPVAIAVEEARVAERVVRVAACRTATSERVAIESAMTAVAEALAEGPDVLRQRHEDDWHRRWELGATRITGDGAAEQALDFARFHLLGLGHGVDEVAIGARGTTGPAYAGHVFWDTDVFVLPFLAAVVPSGAKAALRYRLSRLGAARAAAAAEGFAGARFPWESAATGVEVTPTRVTDPDGRTVSVRTGIEELHITSDIAWAADHYARWTGDEAWLRSDGAPLMVETARFWASRLEPDSDGSVHIRNVIGPDEYHETVDDNAYTNGLVAWHLRTAAAMEVEGVGTDEIHRWCVLADRLVTGFRPRSRRHEQFLGFDRLEPLFIRAVADPPIAADLLLGADVIRRSQIIKQADVVMLHHLLADELPEGSLDADLDYYLPRTAHGSSLSPAIHASVLARAGRTDEALEWFRIAARIDLDDLTGTTAGGLHLATLGGLWQAVARGFLGLGSNGRALAVDPRLPTAWDGVELHFCFRGAAVAIETDGEETRVTADRPLRLRVSGGRESEPGDDFTLKLGDRNDVRRREWVMTP